MQRELAVRRGLLRQVVVDAEGGLPLLVHEVLGEGAAGVRRDVLQRGGLGRGGDHHDGVVHRAGLLEPLHHRRHGRALLPDGDVDADDAGALLIEDRIHRDGGLAGAPVADDQLALAAADRDHRVDRLDPGLQRLLHRLPHDDARAPPSRPCRVVLLWIGAPAVHRAAERVHHPAQHRRPDRHLEQAAGAADLVAFLELEVVAHDGGADVVLFQVEHQPGHRLARSPGGELEHLARRSPT